MNIKAFLLAACVLLGAGCSQPTRPSQREGSSSLSVVVLWDSSGVDSLHCSAPVRGALVYLSSEYGLRTYTTDTRGICCCEGIPSSFYSFGVQANHPEDATIKLVASKDSINLAPGMSVVETVYVKPVPKSGIVINEIFAAGPVNSMFYFFDQFVELYNASDTLKYLDGMMVMRVSGNNKTEEGQQGPGVDQNGDGQIAGVTYAFRFPGQPGEKNHPIRPGQFVVIAAKAVDHRKLCPTSIDLTNADWEFFNQYAVNDIDNPTVPNLHNMIPERTVEFLISLTSDIVVISTGVDSVWADGIDIRTIADGVEYQSSPPPTKRKTLDARVDRGWVQSAPKYSGQSMQRRQPGYDSNNGTLDFEVILHPTPGRQ